MIPKLILKSRTTEVNTASDNIIMAFNKRNWDADTYMINIFAELRTISSNLITAINRSKVESNLEKKDVTRNEYVKALNYIILGAVHHPNATIKGAGKKLITIFDRYGLKITQTSYATESALIDSLLEDLSLPALQADISAISGCVEIVTQLQTSQESFKLAHFSWEEIKAQEGLSICATDIKKEVISTINEKIVLHLNAMQQVNHEVYGELAQTVAQIISDNNEAVKKRSKKKDIDS